MKYLLLFLFLVFFLMPGHNPTAIEGKNVIQKNSDHEWSEAMDGIGGPITSENKIDKKMDAVYNKYLYENEYLNWIKNPFSMPDALRGSGFATNGKCVYMVGGDTSAMSGRSDYVGFAQIMPDGSIGEWQETTRLPVSVWETEAVIYDDHIYTLSGYGTDAVYKAKINVGGSLGDWQPQTLVPQSRIYGHTAFIHENKIYIIGDWFNTMIYYSEIDDNGDIGEWQIAGYLPLRLYACDGILYDNKIYLFGGKEIVGSDQTIVSTVRYAEIQSNGLLGEWQETDAMPDARWFHQVCNYENKVFVMGGSERSNNPIVHMGTINNDGSFSWEEIGTNPLPTQGNGLIINKNCLYYFAGGGSDAIFYTVLDSVLSRVEPKPEYIFPTTLSLEQNFPNPFNPSTHIHFSLPKAGHVKLVIYNALGQKVETLLNAYKPLGYHEVRFNAAHLASGVYYYRIIVDSFGEVENYVKVKKMLLLK